MKKLLSVSDLNDVKTFIDMLSSYNISIYEDIQGSKLLMSWTGTQFILKAKTISNDPLSFVDLTVQKYYQSAINYFNSFGRRVTELMNPSWWYVFEYFTDEQPANIKYDNVPKNGLVLIAILKPFDKKLVWHTDKDELDEWAELMEVDTIPIIYSGKLSNSQIEQIQTFLTTSKTDLNYIFGEDNFAKFFYKILQPDSESSYLMFKSFNDNLEKFIIKFTSDEEISFQILNPFYQKIAGEYNTEYVEIYSLLLVNFLEWFQLVDLTKITLTKTTYDELYIECMCILYNDYIKQTHNDINSLPFDIPKFFKKEKFAINKDSISNTETLSLLTTKKMEYVFKICLSSFYKEKNKKIGIFTERTLHSFNQAVKDIKRKIEDTLNIMNQNDLKNKGYLTFDEVINALDYSNIDYYTNTNYIN